MGERWRFKATIFAILLLMFHRSLSLCSSLNAEGMALVKFRNRLVRDPFGALSNWNDDREGDVLDHCSWFGVECADGKVISLNLMDLCIQGTLAPELGKLTYIRAIILRNNSFSGNIPVELAELKELEVLDLGYNNFSGPFPSDIGNNLSLSILLLDNNKLLGSITPEQYTLTMLSALQVDENQLTSAALGASCNSRSSAWHSAGSRDVVQRRLLRVLTVPNAPKAASDIRKKKIPTPPPPISAPAIPPSRLFALTPLPPSSAPPSQSPVPSIFSPSILVPPESPSASPSLSFTPSPSPMPPPSPAPSALPSPLVDSQQPNSNPKNNRIMIWSGVTGGSALLIFAVVGILWCRSSEMVAVKPWVTGLSGQLQKAFVTG